MTAADALAYAFAGYKKPNPEPILQVPVDRAHRIYMQGVDRALSKMYDDELLKYFTKEKQVKTKPFDLQAALRGDPVRTHRT